MNCPICGADSVVVGVVDKPAEHRIVFHRECDNAHRFTTTEAHPSQLADRRELECATRRIRKRIALFNRNLSIIEDDRPLKEIAVEHGLTETRVRQIRASAPLLPTARARAKIVAENLERNSQ